MKIANAIKNLVGWEEEGNSIFKRMLRRYMIWNATSNRKLIALRYAPIVNFIKSLPFYPEISICDVGCGSMGIAKYLRQEVIGLDYSFNPKFLEYFGKNLTRVRGTALYLPFKSKSIDVVACVDMLEHIPQINRRMVIKELLRVASKYCIIAVPCEHKSQYFEKEINRLFKGKNGIEHPFLKEHIKNGLPETREILAEIKKYSPKAKLTIISNTNLYYWYLLHLISDILIPYSLQFYLTRFKEFLFSPLFLIFKHITGKTTYRKIFICKVS